MGRAVLMFVLVAAGCYKPIADVACTVRCDNGACPAQLTCGDDGLCHGVNTGACTSDAPVGDGPADSSIDSAIDAVLDAVPIDGPNGPILVQQQVTHSVSTTASLALTLQTAPTTGNVLVMIGANTGSFLQSVAGGGVTWTRADYSALCANTEIWYGVVNGSGSTITITCASTGNSWMWVGEWSGLDTANLLDKQKAAGNNGTGTSNATPGSITTTSPRDLVLLAVASQTTTLDAPAPGTWTALPTVGASMFLQGEWYLTTSATGTFVPSVGPTSNCWDAAIASFRIL